MNSKVHPMVVLIVIILTVLTIGVWVWGRGQAKQIGGPADMVVDPAGHLFVQMQNYLLEHDTDGQFVERHDLSVLGVERVLGAIRFFSNGDVLLRSGADSRSLLDNIRAYMRLSNQKPLRSDLPKTGMFRCNLRAASCKPFGSELIDFTSTFGLFIDWTTDHVYVSDSSRHVVRKFSAEGESMGQAPDGYFFPNQLLVHDSQLYVANTNHHHIRIVESATDSFGMEIGTADVVPAEADNNGQSWPSHLARVGDEWWVNNMRTTMDEGGIYVFDSDWGFRYKVDLPLGADPISIITFGGEVLISDWNNDRIHRVTTSGRLLGDFDSSGLHDLITESVTVRWQYQTYAYLAIAAFILLIVALLMRGIVSEGSEKTKAKDKQQESPAKFSDELIWIKPDPRVVRKIKTSIGLSILCVILIIPFFAYLVIVSENRLVLTEFILPVVGIVFVFVIITLVSRTNINTAIGLRGNNITLRSHSGQDVTVPMKDIIYNKVTIAARDTAIFLGRSQMAIYDRELLDSQVFPRLTDAKSVSTWEMQTALIRMRHPQGLMTILVILAVLVSGVWMALKNLVW